MQRADAARGRRIGEGPVQVNQRAAQVIVADLDLRPGPTPQAGAQGLQRRLLGGEETGQPLQAAARRIALGGGEQAVRQPRRAAQGTGKTGALHQIAADAGDHPGQPPRSVVYFSSWRWRALPHEAWRDALARARRGELAFLDHPWPGGGRILKLLCADEGRLLGWAQARGIPGDAIDHRGGIPHIDFRGPRRDVLLAEGWPVARVRCAGGADLPAIAAIARRTWAATYAGLIPEEEQRAFLDRAYSEETLARRLQGAERLLLAEDPDGAPLAFAEFRRRADGEMQLSALYVLPEAQRRGIGALLLQRGPAGPLLVEVEPGNAPAIRFYEKHGFRRTGPRWLRRD